jgi:hypothetical protein
VVVEVEGMAAVADVTSPDFGRSDFGRSDLGMVPGGL